MHVRFRQVPGPDPIIPLLKGEPTPKYHTQLDSKCKFCSVHGTPIHLCTNTRNMRPVIHSNQQVGIAFSRNAKRVVIYMASFAIVAFGVGSEILLRMQAERGLKLRIETYRAALAMRGDSDLGDSVLRLRASTDGLIGVAMLNDANKLAQVYPSDEKHTELAEKALAHVGSTFELISPTEAEPISVHGALIELPRGNLQLPSQALLLIRRVSYRMAWIKALLLVSAGVTTMAALRFYSLNKWFERQVVQPLLGFTRLNLDPQLALTQLPVLEAGLWMETAQIARQFETLLRSLNESDSRVKRLEQESRRQILHKEVGFDLKLKRAKDEATIDVLTKLRNRAFLEGDLEPLFQKQQDRKRRLCAVMMDVDNFKRYNDTHGHQAGDSLLRFVGSLLRGGIRPIDHAVRYGGDEFLLLLPDISGEDGGIVADRLIKLFAQYAGQLSRDCGVSMSAGVACYPDEDFASGLELVKAADAALYSAKHGGKNTVVLGGAQKTDKSPPAPTPAGTSSRSRI